MCVCVCERGCQWADDVWRRCNHCCRQDQGGACRSSHHHGQLTRVRAVPLHRRQALHWSHQRRRQPIQGAPPKPATPSPFLGSSMSTWSGSDRRRREEACGWWWCKRHDGGTVHTPSCCSDPDADVRRCLTAQSSEPQRESHWEPEGCEGHASAGTRTGAGGACIRS